MNQVMHGRQDRPVGIVGVEIEALVGESRLKAFQQSTGARAVIGYRTDVDSDLNRAAFEILLLEALSRYRQIGTPARHLRENYGCLCDKPGFRYIY